MKAKQGRRPKNIGLIFDHHALAERPVFHLDRPFDIAPHGGTRYTVAGLAELVARASGALHAAGLRKGDHLAIIKDNHWDTVLLAAAAARIGAVGAMISSTVPPDHLRTMMERLRPRVLVAGPATLAAAEAAGIALVDPDVSVLVAEPGTGPGTGAGAKTGTGNAASGNAASGNGVASGKDAAAATAAGRQIFEDLLDAPVPPADPCGDDEPMIATHTSGTTGVPKLVVHSPNTLLGVLAKLETLPLPRLSIRKDDTVASCISFVHGRAITWTAAQLARPPEKVVILSGSEPDTVTEMLTAHVPTTLEACPNIFQRWEGLPASHPDLFARIRTYFNTFDAIHPRTVRTFLNASKRRGPLWVQVWGQSEVGPVSPGIYSRRRLNRAIGADSSVTSDNGRPFPFLTRIKVVDPDTRRPLRRGKIGMVLVKTHGRCLTYLGEDERHTEKIWDGWWNTGDLGVHTLTGAIRIIDREVDLIPGVSGIELESLLLERLPETTEVIVLGVPGRPPVPVLSTSDGLLDPARWQDAVTGLPELADPIVIDWDEFPRTGTWKVRRYELRERVLGTSKTYGSGQWT